MSLTVYQAPESSVEWLHLWNSSPERDPFLHPSYVQLHAELTGAAAMCAMMQTSDSCVLFPFLLRDISREPYMLATSGPTYDIATAYGYGGPSVWGSGSKDAIAQRFWQAFDEWAKEQHIVSEFVRFSLFSDNLLSYPGKSWTVADHVVRRLEISDEQLWAEVEHKVRKNVNRAKRSGITVETDIAGERCDNFLSIYNHTLERRNAASFYCFPRLFFDRIGEEMPGSICYFHALREGRVISTELALVSTHYVYSFLGGTDADAFEFRPNDLLKFEIIRWARDRGKKAFVMGGGYEPEDGIFRYKLAFAPDGRTPYIQGGRKLDENRYEALVRAKAAQTRSTGQSWNPAPHFFPQYRA